MMRGGNAYICGTAPEDCSTNIGEERKCGGLKIKQVEGALGNNKGE